ncbi:MAG: MutS-related protein [Beduini sp.]|uniref:MutS-related protein n=1 Tax=Beduini sp. TaxID=1922300 RepID=UPI0039A26A9A
MYKKRYEELYQTEENILRKLKETSNRYTFLRAIVMVVFLLFVYINITHLTVPYFSMLGLSILIFIGLVYFHGKIKKQLMYHENKAIVLKQYQDRFDHHWSEFKETGERYKKNEYFIAKDLDLLGKHSLFQFLNVAKTSLGQQKLVDSLVHPNYSLEELSQRQAAVKELAENVDFSIEIQTLLADTNKKDDIAALKEFLKKIQKGIKPQRYAWIVRFVTVMIMILSLFKVFGAASGSVMFLGILVNLLVANIGGLSYHTHFELVHSISKSLNRYQDIFTLIQETHCHSPYLEALLKDIQNGKAAQGIHDIYLVSEMISQRQNVIGNFFLNGLVVYDLLCIDRLAKWKTRYSEEVLTWFDQFGELEALLSLAIIPQTKTVTAFPTLVEQPLMIDFNGVYHPLMNQEEAVANPFHLVHQANIITGSNMSGKTTFLRTLGINMVLAFAGGALCAEKATLSYMHVLTSMRIEDELSSGTSTFYAELKRIKQMIDESDKHIPICCFIDEIFKGTNSADRIVGAKAAIERLIKDNVLVFVSTHDFELCDLEKTLPLSNYHFKEDYADKQITFDYQIRSGRCHTTNARYLLEMVGIIKDS